jgi:hypothetical protein
MLTLSIVLNLVIVAFCIGGTFWPEYRDNFGERAGMVVVGIVCLIRAAMAAEFEIAERSDILLEAGMVLYAWGQLCAKLRNRRRRMERTITVDRDRAGV